MTIGQSNDDAEQVSASVGLALNVVYRTFTLGFRPAHQWFSEANLFNFLGRDAVAGDVFDPLLRPN